MALVLKALAGARVRAGRTELLSFAGCDSLGLGRHPAVADAARRALDTFGVGAGASRTTTGTSTPHVELERELAAFAGTDDAVCLPAGWLAAQALAQALAAEAEVALVDETAHPALRDAARLSGLPVRTFAHLDALDAARRAEGARALLLTEGTDLVRGEVAPLRALAKLAAGTRGFLVVDDAHGVGVLGARGRGSVEAARAEGPRVFVAGSLSKAFGAHGGFIAGDRPLCDVVRDRAAVYSGATPLPPSIAAAAAQSVRLAAAGDDLRARLRRNAARLRRAFDEIGLAPPRHRLPWFVVAGRPARDLAALSRSLRREGMLVPHLRYFGAPPGGYLKIALTAAHETEDVDRVADALRRLTSTTSGRRPRSRAAGGAP